MRAEDFDAKFDAGEGVIDDLDLSRLRRPLQAQRRMELDGPVWMIASLDREAGRLGIARQAVIKVWWAERLERTAQDAAPSA